jgi:molecular chaperone DnaK
MKPFALGIDLGTSTSEIAIYQKNEPTPIPDAINKTPIIPSLVAINQQGELIVGEDARALAGKEGAIVREVKRQMGSGQEVILGEKNYRPEEISALILKRLRQNAEIYTGQEIKEVVLSVPANFPDAARQATLTAGQLAGLKILHLINEPTAAALSFGIKNLEKEERIAVFDFGGGTLDVSLLEMMEGVLDVRQSYGDPTLGGKDMDEALMSLFLERFHAQHGQVDISPRSLGMLKEHTERVKRELSNQRSTHLFLPMFAARKGEILDLELHIERSDLERAIAPSLDRARLCLEKALRGAKLDAKQIDRVLLVGGTTYIPAVREMVSTFFGKEAKADVHPDLAVSLGAAIKAAQIAGLIQDAEGLMLTDVAPYGLGISVISLVGGRPMLVYEPLLKPNQTIPHSVKRSYRLLHDEQESVHIELYQDKEGTALLPEQAIFTGFECEITDLPPSETGEPHQIDVHFSYNHNGLATLTATLPALQRTVAIEYQPTPLRMTEEARENSLKRLEEIWQQTSKARRYQSLLKRAEHAAEMLTQQHPLHASIKALKEALIKEDEDYIEQMAEKLTESLFSLDDE